MTQTQKGFCGFCGKDVSDQMANDEALVLVKK
jgi:hypothetical protein